ncbi:Synaptic vesicle transporter SVOP and related transporters (major facilitator superfamily) [Ceraceosorus bombacis]|uniref:Synaptic vesicle transporter SVOP and related transporters (Major facilitator superfamily) n=1 Tax=Ceraceosorus bombacis TaxID=401625 RepID=A0A0P1BJ21_9BASI|nr:Synaptic vesicle transporter SVOP and related transporters (major facilitator superfamily) [Ceraceosorus bombacis]
MAVESSSDASSSSQVAPDQSKEVKDPNDTKNTVVDATVTTPDSEETQTQAEKREEQQQPEEEEELEEPIEHRTRSGKFMGKFAPDGRRVLTDEDEGADKVLGVNFPEWKKWWIITVIFLVQLSMNFNTGVYQNGVGKFPEEWGLSEQGARVGAAVFLIAYAFGSQLWAPWSEELGRRIVMQISLGLVNIFQLPCALAPNYGSVVVARVFGGLFSAGGSVTLGMVADMWEAENQAYPIAYVVFSSVGGSSLGPLIGPFAEAYLSWHWIFWLQLIFGGFVQAVHFFTVPETRSSVLLDREAKRRRKEGQEIWGPNEIRGKRFTVRGILTTWLRPFEMLFTEPIVLCCSLLSGFSDSLVFVFIESFKLVYEQWGFMAPRTALTFVPIWIGYIICWASMIIPIERFKRRAKRDPDSVTPESRLWWLLFTAPLEPIGLFIYAWTSFGPDHGPGIPVYAPMVGSVLVAIANYAIYMATIDYMVAAYGPYSSSATGGNAFARNGLAGVATMYAIPLYSNLGYQWASTFLALVGIFVVIPIFVFYFKGAYVRSKSKFASSLSDERKARGGHRVVEDEGENEFGDIEGLHHRRKHAEKRNTSAPDAQDEKSAAGA